MNKKYVIQKGDKCLSSVYLGDLGYSMKREIVNGDFIIVKKPLFTKLFVFRKESWLTFGLDEFEQAKEIWVREISNDERYDNKIKNSLIKSINKLNKYLTEIKQL